MTAVRGGASMTTVHGGAGMTAVRGGASMTTVHGGAGMTAVRDRTAIGPRATPG
jgi:hypothetical protein